MGRPLRQYGPGIYHVAAHGSDRRHLFLDDHDRTDFLDRLSDTFWEREIDVLAYVLLGNHYHALARIPDARLAEALQRLHTEYSRHHNRRHRRRAHLFRAHCLARRINDTCSAPTATSRETPSPPASSTPRSTGPGPAPAPTPASNHHRFHLSTPHSKPRSSTQTGATVTSN